MKTHTYRATTTWAGSTSTGYRGYSRDHDVELGDVDGGPAGIRLSADPAYRGNPELANPELLLVAAASSCQLLAFLAVAALGDVDVVDYVDEATGEMPVTKPPMSVAQIVLRPRIVVRNADRDSVVRMVEQAHDGCYIANSLRTPVRIEPTVEVLP